MTKEFDPRLNGKALLEAEQKRVRSMMERATPPLAMREAPVAPARGVMQLVPDYALAPGGTRRVSGAHWVEPTRLDVLNARAVEAARAQDAEVPRARAELFTPGQVAIAARYRDLVEWRAGSAVKCSKLEAGRGGGEGGRDFMDHYMTAGGELDALRRAIGEGVILQVERRNRGDLREKARKPLTVRAAVDGVVLEGLTLSRLITRHGWAAKGDVRRKVRDAIRQALERMQGYDTTDGGRSRIHVYHAPSDQQEGD